MTRRKSRSRRTVRSVNPGAALVLNPIQALIVNPIQALRRMNPTATQWGLLLAGGTAAVVLAASAIASASDKPSGGGDLPDVDDDEACAPYDYNAAVVDNQIESMITAGERDKAYIAQIVATFLFAQHPSGMQVVFPPGPVAQPGVVCVWTRVVGQVDAMFADLGLDDEDPSEPGSLEWVLRTSADPGYPWEEPVMHVENYPTPGMFVDIGNAEGAWKPSNGYDSMVRAYLGSALSMAGGDVSLATSNAGQALRKEARRAITAVGGFNDLVYGQTNLNYAGGNDPTKPGGDANKPKSGQYVLNAKNRGLNWLPRHKDNIQRIQQGLAPKRSTRLDGSKMGGVNAGNQQMLVWLPALNLEALAQAVPSIEFLQWSDGSSTLDPAPQIVGLGVDMTGVDLPGVEEPGVGQGGGGPGLAP